MATDSILEIRNLSKSFAVGSSNETHAVRKVELQIQRGDFIVLVGANGSGKSTLLNLLAGDIIADHGNVSFQTADGQASDWLAMPRWQRAAYLARVHQDPRRGTASGMTVWENLRLASSRQKLPSPWRFRPANQDRDWFAARLQDLELGGKLDGRVSDLSQGQRQRLALEFAMLRKPSILLLDEHTASLDQANATKCLEATAQLSVKNAVTVIMVTHNLMDALTYGNRLIVMRNGVIEVDLSGDSKRELTLDQILKLCGYVV